MNIQSHKGPQTWVFYDADEKFDIVTLRRCSASVDNMFHVTAEHKRLSENALDVARAIGNRSRRYAHITQVSSSRLSCTCHVQTAKSIARAIVGELV